MAVPIHVRLPSDHLPVVMKVDGTYKSEDGRGTKNLSTRVRSSPALARVISGSITGIETRCSSPMRGGTA